MRLTSAGGILNISRVNNMIISIGCEWTDTINCLATTISAFIAVLSFVLSIVVVIIAIKEYNTVKRHKLCDILVEYNQRYADSESIQKVVNYVLTIYCNENTNVINKPSINDKEMFLRFFEELSHMAKCKYINLNDVKDYFSYYFIILWQDDKFFWDKEMIAPHGCMQEAKHCNWTASGQLYEQLMHRTSSIEKGEYNKFRKEFQKKFLQFENALLECKEWEN